MSTINSFIVIRLKGTAKHFNFAPFELLDVFGKHGILISLGDSFFDV